MVACKSTSRERWRQVLNEAARIPEKYLLTVDTGISHATIDAMQRAALRVFLPAPIITAFYADNAGSIGTVSELLTELRQAIGHA
jgi:hypothetical protein